MFDDSGSALSQRELSAEDMMRFLGEARGIGFVPDGVHSANVIKFLVKEEKGKEALYVLNQMKADRIKPDVCCYTMVSDGVVSMNDYEKMEELLDEMFVLGLVPDVYAYNVYIRGLCKQVMVDEAYQMLARMEQSGFQPGVTNNLILAGFCRKGNICWAKEIMKEMKWKGVWMDLRTHTIFLDGLVSCHELFDAIEYLIGMLDNNLKPCLFIKEKIICSLLQKGLVCDGLLLFENLLTKAIVPGNTALEVLVSTFKHQTETKFIRETSD